MIRLNLKKIIKKLPNDFSKHCTRDISLLSCSVFGESHIKIKEVFDVDFAATLWVVKRGAVIFYRSKQEYYDFSKRMGERYKNLSYAKKSAKKLIEMTDRLNIFLRQNKKLIDFVTEHKKFFDNYRNFFCYHQAVNWGGDYLYQLFLNKKKGIFKTNVKILDSAYKYNELIVPKIEGYFKKLGISNFLYNEIDNNIHKTLKIKQPSRSLLFINNERFILSEIEAKKLEKFIENKYGKNYKKIKSFRGQVANKGFFRGKVGLILNFDELRKCKNNDILVVDSTRPQFNQFIKKAGAIITDQGGMLSHASILSREFNIPCIVGTKIATKILRDGQMVEVDANKGIVKILNKKQ